jgi:NAD(P)-dependent dehydrogenase (short-subunit alcohol dehydrogenase family)
MPQGGRIINIGTVASKMGLTGMGSYAISKAAQDSITETLAQELGRTHGITVNTVAPGPVKTDIVIDAHKSLGVDITEPLRAKARGSERLADPEDIADVVAWVASDKARWITAQFISASSGINGTM